MDEFEVQVRTDDHIVSDLYKNNCGDHCLSEKKTRKGKEIENTHFDFPDPNLSKKKNREKPHFSEICTGDPDPCLFERRDKKKKRYNTRVSEIYPDDPDHCLFEKRKRKNKRANNNVSEICTDDPEEKKKKGEYPTKEKSEVVVVSPYFVPKCQEKEDSGTGFSVCVKTKIGKTSNDTHFSDIYTDEADPCLFEKRERKDREHPMKENPDVVVSPVFVPKYLEDEDSGTGFPVCVKIKREKKRKDEENTHISEMSTDGPDPSLSEKEKKKKKKKKKKRRKGENPVKEQSDVVSPYFATKCLKGEDLGKLPVCVKTKLKTKRKGEDNSGKEYTSVGVRKRIELEPGFLDSVNVECGASSVDKAMHEAWLDDFFSQFAYTAGTKSCASRCNTSGKNVNKCSLGSESKVKLSKGKKGVWDKGRVVSPYFVKEAKADLIEQGQKKESVSVRKVSPYFYSSEQEDVHLAKMQTKSRKAKRKKSSPALTKAEMRNEAYRRITQEITWKPPVLETKLLQHDHASDPWRVLVICMLLNLTGGLQLKRVLPEFFKLCPNAKRATEICAGDIENVIRTLGLQRKRSAAIQRLSREYLEESWTHVTDLTGVGKYAADAYAIFCAGKWECVRPCDKELLRYWRRLCDHFSSKGTSVDP